MNWLKKQVTKQNVILLLLIGMAGHNYYLQTKIADTLNAANNAEYEARQAKNIANVAASYSSSAANYASEAADNANNAALIASDASDYAYKAYTNSFGYECWSCP